MPKKKQPRAKVRGLSLNHGLFVYQPPQRDGVRPKRVALGTRDFAAAVAMVQEIQRRGTVARLLKPLAEEIPAYLADKRASGAHRSACSTVADRTALRRLAAAVRSRPAAVTAADILAWRDAMLAEPLSRATVQSYMRSAGSFFSWLLARGKISFSPFAGLPRGAIPGAVPTRRDRFCTKAQRDTLIANCENPDLRAAMYLGFYAGLRRGEILAARPGWLIGLEAGRPTHIRVQNETGDDGTRPFVIKDAQPRTVPLAAPLADFLEAFAPGRHPYLVKPDRAGGRGIYRWDWRKPWSAYVESHGLGWVGAHTMRHTFVTLLLSSPPDTRPSLLHLERWTGTNTETLKKHYAHLIDDGSLIDAAN